MVGIGEVEVDVEVVVAADTIFCFFFGFGLLPPFSLHFPVEADMSVEEFVGAELAAVLDRLLPAFPCVAASAELFSFFFDTIVLLLPLVPLVCVHVPTLIGELEGENVVV